MTANPQPTAADTGEAGAGEARCRATVIELDFEGKREATISLDGAAAAMASGKFVWIDLDAGDPTEGRKVLAMLGLVGDDVVDLALREEPSTQYGRYDGYVHMVISGYRRRGVDFDVERVSVALGERFLLTTHRGPVSFLDAVRRDYRGDFLRFAKTPSFLLYEIWDHLIENYLDVQTIMGERVEALQEELRLGQVDDGVFARVSQLGRGPAPLPKAAVAGARRAVRSVDRAARWCSARRRSGSSATWWAPSITCCRTCWSTATSCPNR